MSASVYVNDERIDSWAPSALNRDIADALFYCETPTFITIARDRDIEALRAIEDRWMSDCGGRQSTITKILEIIERDGYAEIEWIS